MMQLDSSDEFTVESQSSQVSHRTREMMPLREASSTLVKPEPKRSDPMTSRFSPGLLSLAYPLGRYGVLPVYFRQITVAGREHLPTTGPLLLAPTHRSRWDALMVPYAAGRDITGQDLRFMVSSDEVRGVQGWFIRRFGGFPINTKQPAIASLRHGIELLQAGESLVIFPEGGIFRDTEIHPLKPGLGRLALHAEASQPGLGVKVVPISIRYSDAFPHWRSAVDVQIGAPLEVASYLEASLKVGAQHFTRDLEASLKQLAAAHTLTLNTQ